MQSKRRCLSFQFISHFFMRVYLYIVEFVLVVNMHAIFEPGRQATFSLVMHMHYA